MNNKNLVNGKAINCFAIGAGVCSVLNTTQCVTCKFFKTKKQLKSEEDACKKRLKAISYINKYGSY